MGVRIAGSRQMKGVKFQPIAAVVLDYRDIHDRLLPMTNAGVGVETSQIRQTHNRTVEPFYNASDLYWWPNEKLEKR